MEKKVKTRKQRKGITLIALVITIIVLLILAGITINLTIGQDGILKRAEEAGKNYTQAAAKEKTELAEFSNLTDKIIDNVTKNHYTMVNGVPVPKGFSHKEGTKDTGFVIIDVTKNADGTPTDTNGNEFVWVPCTLDGANGTIKYDRYEFLTGQPASGTDTATSSTKIKYSTSSDYVFTEQITSDEASSIRTYGGYYIGRYESGVAGADESVNKTPDGSEEWTGYSNGKLVIKQNEQVWNYITRDKAKKLSEELYKKSNGDSVNSKLCSSYAWDTALKFIETINPTYPTDSTQGNYTDKSAALGKPAKTGLTEAVNNIYDMGGNVYEWTTETYSYENNQCTSRGGGNNNSSSNTPAAYRTYDSRTHASDYISFRTTIYL